MKVLFFAWPPGGGDDFYNQTYKHQRVAACAGLFNGGTLYEFTVSQKDDRAVAVLASENIGLLKAVLLWKQFKAEFPAGQTSMTGVIEVLPQQQAEVVA